jgi:hypothetical protein
MPGVEFNEQLFSDPQVLRALHEAGSNAAFGLWVRCVLYAARYELGDQIPAGILFSLVYPDAGIVDVLVRAGLLVEEGDGYRIANWMVGLSRRPAWVVRRSRAEIPEATRAAVFERDGNACVLCGSAQDLTLDHIEAWSKGGPDTVGNLRVLCRSCNSAKGAR